MCNVRFWRAYVENDCAILQCTFYNGQMQGSVSMCFCLYIYAENVFI